MNVDWEQNWLLQFDNDLDHLMQNYPEAFEYEDLNRGVRIDDDKAKLRALFKTFENGDPERSKHYFKAEAITAMRGGTLEWTWEIHHNTDFLGMPAAGRTTKVRGMTPHAFDPAGKIILGRGLRDTAELMRQLDQPTPARLEF